MERNHKEHRDPHDGWQLDYIRHEQPRVGLPRNAYLKPLACTNVESLPVVDLELNSQPVVRFDHERPHFQPIQRHLLHDLDPRFRRGRA